MTHAWQTLLLRVSRPLTHRSVLQVDLVADDDEREVLGVAGARLDEELVAPPVERLERVRHRHVEDEHAAVGAAVEGDAEALEALLAGRVPDLVNNNTHAAHTQTQRLWKRSWPAVSQIRSTTTRTPLTHRPGGSGSAPGRPCPRSGQQQHARRSHTDTEALEALLAGRVPDLVNNNTRAAHTQTPRLWKRSWPAVSQIWSTTTRAPLTHRHGGSGSAPGRPCPRSGEQQHARRSHTDTEALEALLAGRVPDLVNNSTHAAHTQTRRLWKRSWPAVSQIW